MQITKQTLKLDDTDYFLHSSLLYEKHLRIVKIFALVQYAHL